MIIWGGQGQDPYREGDSIRQADCNRTSQVAGSDRGVEAYWNSPGRLNSVTRLVMVVI